jgi:hypothetical protein
VSDDQAPHPCDPQSPGDLILGVRRDQEYGADWLIELGANSGLPGLEALTQASRLHEVGRVRGELSRESRQEEAVPPELEGAYDFRLMEVPEGGEQIAAGSLIQLFMGTAKPVPKSGEPPPVIAQPNHRRGSDREGSDARP